MELDRTVKKATIFWTERSWSGIRIWFVPWGWIRLRSILQPFERWSMSIWFICVYKSTISYRICKSFYMSESDSTYLTTLTPPSLIPTYSLLLLISKLNSLFHFISIYISSIYTFINSVFFFFASLVHFGVWNKRNISSINLK